MRTARCLFLLRCEVQPVPGMVAKCCFFIFSPGSVRIGAYKIEF